MHEWSVEEVNAALPEVRERVARVLGLLEQVREESGRPHDTEDRSTVTNGRRHLEPAEDAVRTALIGLEAEGIVLRDADRGLVDFHAVTPSGRPYWLCWVVGEPEVAWWHWPESGFDGRTPLGETPE